MVEVSLTVGKLDASLALLLTKDHHMIEFPTILLPNGVRAGSIVKIRCDQDVETEQEEKLRFQKVQDEILETFGKNVPKAPVLKIKNTTQTSCILEWEPLDLGMATLKNLVLYKDGRKVGAIPQPLTNHTTKLSGLPIDKTFHFQLRLDTTAGTYNSEDLEVTTHKMTDLSGITVCLGDMTPNDPFSDADIEAVLKNMGAHYPPQRQVQVDTTHFLCTRENKQNPEFVRAGEMNIPIIRPEWLKACERERRIVGVRDFYVKDCVLPDIFARNYWQKLQSGPVEPESKKEEVAEEKAEEKEEKADGSNAESTEAVVEKDIAEKDAENNEPAPPTAPPAAVPATDSLPEEPPAVPSKNDAPEIKVSASPAPAEIEPPVAAETEPPVPAESDIVEVPLDSSDSVAANEVADEAIESAVAEEPGSTPDASQSSSLPPPLNEVVGTDAKPAEEIPAEAAKAELEPTEENDAAEENEPVEEAEVASTEGTPDTEDKKKKKKKNKKKGKK